MITIEDAYDLICVMSDMRKLQEFKSELKQEGSSNMCKGLEEMLEDEMQRGKAFGMEQVEDLYRKLYYDNRLDDMKRAFEDKDYRRQLIEEYGLQAEPEPYSFSKSNF